MLDISFTELLLIAIVAVVFIRPKDLPVVMRTLAQGYKSARKFMREVHDMFNDIAKEAGLDEEKKAFEHEMQLIQGDDGKMYPAYDMETVRIATQTKLSSAASTTKTIPQSDIAQPAENDQKA